MAGFLYYIPKIETPIGQSGEAWATIKSVGLHYVFEEGASITSVGCAGPDGERGRVFALEQGKRTPTVSYRSGDQTWRKCSGGKYWLGYDRHHPPTPMDLMRPRIVEGHVLELGGHDWTIPLGRTADGDTMAPKSISIDDDGNPVFEPMDAYRDLIADCDRVWQRVRDEAKGGDEIAENDSLADPSQWWAMAVRALSINYRVSRWEVGTLKLLDTDSARQVMLYMIDHPSIIAAMVANAEAEKKSDRSSTPDTSATDSGATDSPETTDRPLQTSGSTPTNAGGDA